MAQRFPREERIRSKRDFDRVFHEGRGFQLREIAVKAVLNDLGHPRLGLSVGKSHGGAVRRNRIKRLIREAYRLNRHRITVPCDIVVMPRIGWRDMSLRAIEPTLRKALDRIGQAFASG